MSLSRTETGGKNGNKNAGAENESGERREEKKGNRRHEIFLRGPSSHVNSFSKSPGGNVEAGKLNNKKVGVRMVSGREATD